MKKYFYSNGENKNGPFSFEDLKNENITKETLIWFDGLDDWKPAKDIEELNEIFELKPPPIFENEEGDELENNDFNMDMVESDPMKGKTQHFISKRPEMFTEAFSFDGRIGRLEYGLSLIIFLIYSFLAFLIAPSLNLSHEHSKYFMSPGIWFIWAQGAKRCHDRNNSGWFQLNPFYELWMLFGKGDSGFNNYGPNPKF